MAPYALQVTCCHTAWNRLGQKRFLCYVAAQLLGACSGAALLRLSLPPSYLETPFVTAGSLTAAHPIQVTNPFPQLSDLPTQSEVPVRNRAFKLWIMKAV